MTDIVKIEMIKSNVEEAEYRLSLLRDAIGQGMFIEDAVNGVARAIRNIREVVENDK